MHAFLSTYNVSQACELFRLIYTGIPSSIPAVVLTATAGGLELMNFAPKLSASATTLVDPLLLVDMEKGVF